MPLPGRAADHQRADEQKARPGPPHEFNERPGSWAGAGQKILVDNKNG
jgi:hypothetical protein